MVARILSIVVSVISIFGKSLVSLMRLIKYYAAACMLFASSAVFSADSVVEVNNQPLSIVLTDGSQVNVSTCNDFIALRKTGKTVKDILHLPDPQYYQVKNNLFECYLNEYVTQHHFSVNTSPSFSFEQIIHHFPASAALIVSDSEEQKIKHDFYGKTLIEYVPDLQAKSINRYISEKKDTGYFLKKTYSYKNQQNQDLNIIVIVGYSLTGTLGIPTAYRIDNMSGHVWKITKLDENSPL